jgi:hypothetical protein
MRDWSSPLVCRVRVLVVLGAFFNVFRRFARKAVEPVEHFGPLRLWPTTVEAEVSACELEKLDKLDNASETSSRPSEDAITWCESDRVSCIAPPIESND